MITGGCACRQVRYESRGSPLFQLLCHCRDCQKASGTGGVPVMGVPKNLFTVSGATKSHAVIGGSAKNAIRNFCAHCGSLLFGTPESIPTVVTIYAGSMDDPSLFKPDLAMFTRDRPDWAQCALGIPEFE